MTPKNSHESEWRPLTINGEHIDGYFVSENGFVYNGSTKRMSNGRENTKYDKHRRIKIHGKPYYVSRLVAEAFVPNDDPVRNTVVRHINDDPTNNHYTNLKWGTHQENTMDAIRNGKIVLGENLKYTKCENHPHALLTNNQVETIAELLSNGVKLRDIAKEYNVDVNVIRHIYKGDSWRPITEKYLPFPKQDPIHKSSLSDKVKNKIIKILKSDINTKPSEIIARLKLDDTPSVRGFIGCTKRKMKSY